MSAKLISANPEETMVIREVVPGVTTLSVPFLRFGLIKFGGRATIIKLQSGSLFVFSPVALTETVKSTLAALSPQPPKYIVAPDLEHHIHLSAWSAAFPSAHLLAPAGLAEKRAQQNHKDKSVTILNFSTIFQKSSAEKVSVDEEFDREFETEFVDAHVNKEIIFFHKPTKTLIQADLLFNLPATEQFSKTGESATSGFFSTLASKLLNTAGAAGGQKWAIWNLISRRDRPGFNASIARINKWDFQNIISCHGDSIIGDGKSVFEKVFARHIEAANAEGGATK
ncbi:hypothetical protein B0O99DRAFT_574229 [Bisporella sp. PMI_857]|nr:hypothetical protein B0O99DRAFT_574229 [Bisporella sp. PMI_857]